MIGRNVAIYVATTPIDMRKSFGGLAAAARESLRKDPESGALFVFANKRRPKKTNSAPLRASRPTRAEARLDNRSKLHLKSIGSRQTKMSTPWGIKRHPPWPR